MSSLARWCAALAFLFPAAALAFCGFYVSGAGAQLFNDASMVVLLRDGTRTVLSMQNNYRGPTDDFALVVPVPVVLHKEDVKTIPREAFSRLDELTSPRLVESYTEQCVGLMSKGGNMGAGAGGAPQSAEAPSDLGVKIEAKFNVEEYEILILSAQNSVGLEIWLKENKYRIPAGAEPLLKPYVEAGSKFFVAKVDAKKAKFKKGQLVLSPLRFAYDAESFQLPVRLGLANSSGKQDLIVHVIAKSRYEVANMPNVQVPTNYDVRARTRPQFGGFYADVLDRTFTKNKGAAVTEFAWEGALPPPEEMSQSGIYGVTCDPCPPPHPVDNPLARYLGVGLLPGIKSDEAVASFARHSTITRLHLRYTKESPPDDLVFKAVSPIAGGTPEVKTPGPAKHNRFQARYVIWLPGCGPFRGMGMGGGFGGGGGYTSALGPLSAAAGNPATSAKRGDPLEELFVADVPELGLTAVDPKKHPAPP